MRSKRDRRRTPLGTSLAPGIQSSGKSIEDWWTDAAPPDGAGDGDTASVKTGNTISVNSTVLNGEGTSKGTARVIPAKQTKSPEMLKFQERKKKTRNSYRVPVLNPDGTPAMPTTNRRANKWIKEGKAKRIKNKLGIFQVLLIKESGGRKKQDIGIMVDPGSAFTGIGVVSRKAILYGCTLELPGYKKDSNPTIIKNRFGKKIEKYPNSIVQGMDKRRQLRRGRRYRKTRRRPSRFLNRSKTKIPPSILARKQLELKVVTELSKIYPINIIGFEDIKFNHFKDKKGEKGQFFSHVEVGKNWLLERLRKLFPKNNLKIIRGYHTNMRRLQLGLKKEKDKTLRDASSHVNDCIAMGTIILGLGIETKNKFKYDTITRPKYSRRFLHLEQFGKGGIRRRHGGTTCKDGWTNIRKGDYVEAIQGKKIFRGWVSGFIDDKRIISVSNFDWNRLGQFGESNIRLLDRDNGLLIMSRYKETTREEHFEKISGTRQIGIEDAW